jgi:tRNA A37 threonylcarbamoyltransferase TsaD
MTAAGQITASPNDQRLKVNSYFAHVSHGCLMEDGLSVNPWLLYVSGKKPPIYPFEQILRITIYGLRKKKT